MTAVVMGPALGVIVLALARVAAELVRELLKLRDVFEHGRVRPNRHERSRHCAGLRRPRASTRTVTGPTARIASIATC